jgi:hypothetical protein
MKKTLLLLAAMTLGGATAATAATPHNLPACSRTVTRNCVKPASTAKSQQHMNKHQAPSAKTTAAPKTAQHR